MSDISSKMFHANDPLEHTLCWSNAMQGWRIENPTVGIVSEFTTFGSGMSALETITGLDAKGFGVSPNPYSY